jgi:hypothetical protein
VGRGEVYETISQEKKVTKKGLVKWFKVQVLSSNPSIEEKKKTKP